MLLRLAARYYKKPQQEVRHSLEVVASSPNLFGVPTVFAVFRECCVCQSEYPAPHGNRRRWRGVVFIFFQLVSASILTCVLDDLPNQIQVQEHRESMRSIATVKTFAQVRSPSITSASRGGTTGDQLASTIANWGTDKSIRLIWKIDFLARSKRWASHYDQSPGELQQDQVQVDLDRTTRFYATRCNLCRRRR